MSFYTNFLIGFESPKTYTFSDERGMVCVKFIVRKEINRRMFLKKRQKNQKEKFCPNCGSAVENTSAETNKQLTEKNSRATDKLYDE